jgi:hypothetical protein
MTSVIIQLAEEPVSVRGRVKIRVIRRRGERIEPDRIAPGTFVGGGVSGRGEGSGDSGEIGIGNRYRIGTAVLVRSTMREGIPGVA